jgi:hypothetical protein
MEQAMQTATIEVKYVGPPKEGKQYGFIKGADNSTFPVKADRIREFEPGNKYELAWTEGHNGFKNIIGVKRIVAQTAPQGDFTQISEPKATPKQTNGQQYWQPKPTSPKDGKRMCVTSLMNAGITSHQIPFTREALAAAFRAVSEAFDDVFRED